MLEELDVAAEVEVEESVETEDQEEITVNREEDDHEQMTITRKHENHLIYDRHPMSPYEYFKQHGILRSFSRGIHCNGHDKIPTKTWVIKNVVFPLYFNAGRE